ncbi:FMN-binding negative transcriptional regulator [Piscinibacter sp.]|uniref:FMN-binding negative transcriptional regulator n=1 Tax=Piscinibacter sp. TaxID=1903157 RepID=UPI002CB430CD|nr:FMN-binding negative transcriptional regulator [Albitalea sp.]HUG23555.1 FMN-binding negative transcriptional regulator [Albitalea sp.]
MYVPKHFEETDAAVLHRLIESQPLGAWVTTGADGLEANHLPFMLDPQRGPHGTLVGHVARANPAWRSFTAGAECVVIFQGPQAYVSPSWYPSKDAHGKVVPTWNYAVVHAHGVPRAIEDPAWLLALVDRLSRRHEAAQRVPWKVTDAPPGYIEGMLAAIVGIEIPISRIAGKWKVSQNRPEADRLGVVAGLRSKGEDTMAQLVARDAPS